MLNDDIGVTRGGGSADRPLQKGMIGVGASRPLLMQSTRDIQEFPFSGFLPFLHHR